MVRKRHEVFDGFRIGLFPFGDKSRAGKSAIVADLLPSVQYYRTEAVSLARSLSAGARYKTR